MKQRELHWRKATFAALIFVILGYAVKFYPQQLHGFDGPIQAWLRGELPAPATVFWTKITLLGNTSSVLLICLLTAAYFYWKRWKAEAYLMLSCFVVMGVVSTALKYVYQRPRPTLEWLLDTVGYSFPSWHTASTLMVAGALVIIVQQRMRKSLARWSIQLILLTLAVLVALSRIYIGVHYPTDIIGGWLLAYLLLEAIYPFYDQKRFEWRFQSKQD